MPDPIVPTPTPTPAPVRKRGYFNKAQLDDIDLAESLLSAARKNADPLAKRKIDSAYLDGLGASITEARRRISQTGQSTEAAQTANSNANAEERKLLTALQGIQSAAKQWHKMLDEDEDPSTNFPLDGYLIGPRLNPSRAVLLQNAATLIAKAHADDLPGYADAADIAPVEAALAQYRGLETDSDEADAEQSGDRVDRDALIKKINTRRSALQHAADGLWPFIDEGNTTQRVLFQLPLSRPLSV